MEAQGMALTRSKNTAAVATNQTANVMKTIIATIAAVITTVVIVSTIDTPNVTEQPQGTVQYSVAAETAEPTPEQPAETPAETPVQQPEPVAVAAEPEPEPVQAAPAGGCEQYRYLFEKYTDWDVPTAMAVAHAESSACDPTAHNQTDGHDTCTGSHGLMQVACFWADFYQIPRDSLYDPETNVEIAHRVYQRSGSFYPWTTWTGGKYKQFIGLYQ